MLMMFISTALFGAAKSRKLIPSWPGIPLPWASLPVKQVFPDSPGGGSSAKQTFSPGGGSFSEPASGLRPAKTSPSGRLAGSGAPGTPPSLDGSPEVLIETDLEPSSIDDIEIKIADQQRILKKIEAELAAVAKALKATKSLNRNGKEKSLKSVISGKRNRKVGSRIKTREQSLTPGSNNLRIAIESLDNRPPEDERSLVEQRYFQKTVNFLEHVQGLVYGKSGSELSKLPKEEVRKLVKPLCHLVKTELTQERHRFCGIVLLGKLQVKSCLPTLKSMARHPLVNLRCAALGALGRFPSFKGGKKVLKSLNDGNQFVRAAGISALAKIGEEGVYREIVPLLSDSSLVVRRSACEVIQETPLSLWMNNLEKFENKKGLGRLLDLLSKTYPEKENEVMQNFMESPKWLVRSCAVSRAISKGSRDLPSGDGGVPGAPKPANRPDGDVLAGFLPLTLEAMRMTDKELLAELGKIVTQEKSIPLNCYGIKERIKSLDFLPSETKRKKLLQLAVNEDSLVRVAAVKALGEMKLPEIFEDLSKIILSEKNSFVKASAISSLTSHGEKAESVLIQTLKSQDVEVILAAIKGLAQAGGVEAMKSLEPLIGSRNPTIKFFAEQGLDEIKRRRGA